MVKKNYGVGNFINNATGELVKGVWSFEGRWANAKNVQLVKRLPDNANNAWEYVKFMKEERKNFE